MLKLQRILITIAPVSFLIRKSKNIYLPGFEGIPLYDVMVFLLKQVKTHGLTERASAISYNFVMALPPSLLFLFTLIPNLPFVSRQNITIQLHSLIYDIIPSPVYNREVIKFVDSFIDNSRFGLLSFGLLLSLFFASNAVMGLMRAFNKNYIGFEKRKGLKDRLVALRLTMLLFGLLLGYLILLIMQGAVLKLLVTNDTWREVFSYLRWLLMILLIFFAIGYIFKYAPSVKKRWKIRSPGAILATALSIISSLGFSIFVTSFGKYNALYGSIGTIMMVMALIFINSLVLLIGFELNVSIRILKAQALYRVETETSNVLQAPPTGSIPLK
ncbi:MAG: YihY/virulence factor BrkB family protein [Gloeobacteraceae cyanobacterium ES-bin-316]|nr:YihY/virulence factor BrkB family protein [Ferruginibacter sp.]